jgi:dCMP deaminase
MSIAQAVSTRATCDRKHVGAIIVVDFKIISTGYNGSVGGMPHCDDAGHDIDAGHCVRTIHAEMNALAQAAKLGVSVDGGSLYATASPCWGCFRVLVSAGLKRFIYGESHREVEHNARIQDAAKATHIEVVHFASSNGRVDSHSN